MRHARHSSIVAVIAVAAIALLLSACGGDDSSSGSNTVATLKASNGKVTVDAHDIYFSAHEIDTSPGPLTVTLDNKGSQQHTFTIDNPKFNITTSGKETKSGTITLTAGRYTFYCKITGHRAAGMVGTLVVK